MEGSFGAVAQSPDERSIGHCTSAWIGDPGDGHQRSPPCSVTLLSCEACWGGARRRCAVGRPSAGHRRGLARCLPVLFASRFGSRGLHEPP